MQNAAIEVAVGGGMLRAVFVTHGDRLGHLIWFAESGREPRALLESIEGTPDDAWPASPPLQSVSVETLGDGRRVAFLVGMSGGSHWSASVEADAEQNRLVFDIACRHNAAAGWRGSRYRALMPEKLVPEKVAIVGDVAVETKGNVISVRAKEPSSSGGTTRWRYAIRLTDHMLSTTS